MHSAPIELFLPDVFKLCTLWLFNIAMENSPFIDDFPSELNLHINGWDVPWRTVSHNQRLPDVLKQSLLQNIHQLLVKHMLQVNPAARWKSRGCESSAEKHDMWETYWVSPNAAFGDAIYGSDKTWWFLGLRMIFDDFCHIINHIMPIDKANPNVLLPHFPHNKPYYWVCYTRNLYQQR